MSLVERAIKKLQESKQGVVPAQAAAAAAVSTPFQRTHDVPPISSGDTQPIVADASRIQPKSSRIVQIDKAKLRSMDLLAPASVERQIGSQYQQVKRPLVSSALGRGEAAIPQGNLIMLASALPGEGKTFTSINLALSMALEKDIDVLLIDADVAKPHVSRIFDLQNERGLLDLLVDPQLDPNSVILSTDVPRLRIMPAGRKIETATELLASERMSQLSRDIASSARNRVVLFDSPPLLLSTESRALVSSVGQVVLVVRAEVTPQKAVMDAIEAVGDDKPISLILNQTHAPPSSGYYGYGTYGDTASGGSQ